MTNIDDNIVNRRVLVDWDGDGFINEGVETTTPPNLFPNCLYPTSSYLKGYTASGVANFTDSSEYSQRGIIKRSIRLGDQATSIRFMFDDYKTYQRHLSDPVNIIQGNPANSWYFTGTYPQARMQQLGTQLGIRGSWLTPTDPPFNNGVLGDKVSLARYGASSSGGNNVAFALGYNDPLNYGVYYNFGTGAPSAPQWTLAFYRMPTYSGIPVTPGQQYTIIVYIYIPRTSVPSGSVFGQSMFYLYSNNSATAPTAAPKWQRDPLTNFGLTGSPAHALNTWIPMKATFTVPSGAATHMAIDFQAASDITGDIYIGGLMVLPGNITSYPTRYWDSSYTFSADQFSYVYPGDSQPYTVSYYVRSPNGITKLKPTKYVSQIATNTTTSTVLSDITVTSDWTRVDMSVSADTVERGVWLEFTAEKGGVPVDASHAGDVEFSGFQIVKGTTTYPFHAGDAYGYEDITPYVLSLTTSSGKSSFNDELPKEGTIELTLNNDDKRFSPNYEGSPLYGLLTQNLKMIVQLWDIDNGVWADIWNGWTAEFLVEPGRSGSRQATINGNQGLFRLADGQLGVPITYETDMSELSKAIIESSGWRGALNVLQSFAGLRTELGTNAYTMDTNLLYDEVQEGINRIEISGRDWTQSTDPRKALEDVLGAENATMWLTRTGAMKIVNRNYWITNLASDNIILDTDVQKAEYQYGEDIINAVEITVTKNKQVTFQPVWATKRPVKLIPNQVWVVDLNPTYTEGKPKTVISYTLDGMTKNVYTEDIGLTQDNTHNATPEQATAVTIELLGEAGARPQVRIRNSNSIDMWVMVSIKGNYLETGDSVLVKVEDQDSIELLQGKHVSTYSNPLLNDERYATSYGEFLMLRKSQPRGEFTSFTIMVRNMDDLNRVLNLTLGDIVTLKEQQSDETGLYHTIIGEDFEITDSSTLTVTYHTALTMQEEYAKADVSVLADPTENMINDMYSAYALGANSSVSVESGVAYGLDKVLLWNSGGFYYPKIYNIYGADVYGGCLILNPTPGQVRTWRPITDLRVYPATDASGNAFVTNPVLQPGSDRTWANFYSQFPFPISQDKIIWYSQLSTRKLMTASGTAQAFVGAIRSKTTDESVGAASKYQLLIPVTPNANYLVTMNGVAQDYGQLGYGTYGTGQILKPIDRNGAILPYWNNVIPNTIQNYFQDYGAGIAVGTSFNYFQAQDASLNPINAIGFQVYSKANAFEAEGIYDLELVRYSQNKTLYVDPATTTYYTAFVRLTSDTINSSEVTLAVYDDVTGNYINYDHQLVNSSGITKVQVAFTGHARVWAALFVGNSNTNVKVVVLGHGATDFNPSTVDEIMADYPHDLVYA